MLLAVAKITRPHGIKGEVRVSVLLDSPELFCQIKTVVLDGAELKVKSARPAENGMAIVHLDGIVDRNTAELLRDKMLYVERSKAENLKKNKYFIDDLIGLTLLAGDKNLGTIAEVYKGGKTADVIYVRGEKEIMFPFLKVLNAEVDFDKRIMAVDEKAFFEIAVYED